MRRLPSFAACMAATAIACVAFPISAAALNYDTPSLSVVEVSRSSIRLEVQAGPSGAPFGFTVEWMTIEDYNALGGQWPSDPDDPRIAYCQFTGTPTLNVTPGENDYLLGPNGRSLIEFGDLFDETGMYTYYVDELPGSQGYVARGYANGGGGTYESGYSSTIQAVTLSQGQDCTRTQGYWKNHPQNWPAGCLPMLLGTVAYTQAELLSIFNTPAAGNGLIFLAHQLIATKLNICNGANPATIAATVAAADALIDGLVVPPVGGGFIAPATASPLTDTLDSYNNGLLGPPDCDAVPAVKSSWGRLKTLYR